MARKKSRIEDDSDSDIDIDASKPSKPQAPPDAYVGMLGISFVALVISAALLYFDFESLNQQTVQPPSVAVPALGARTITAG